jgi:N-acetylmuramoyl-L-alanine amidase
MDRLLVAQPSRAEFTVTDAGGFWFYGTAVAGVPVYVNNQPITDRTSEGFFSVFMPLERGRNTFTFTQAGQTPVTRVIINNAPAQPRPPATMPFGIENAFPATNEWARMGATLTLRATAPAGATVTAEIAGQTIELTQTNTNLQSTASNFVAAQFTGSFTLSDYAEPDAIVNLGSPVYTMTWGDQTRTATANGVIRQLGVAAPFFAEITGDAPWIFPGATTTGGANWSLSQGQVDRVIALTGDWVRLASGGWVEREHVRTWEDAAFGTRPVLSEGQYTAGRYADVIAWGSEVNTAVQATFDGREFIVSMGMDSALPTITYEIGDTLFSEIRMGVYNDAPAYFMTLREGESLEGFYTTYENGELQLHLRRRRPLSPGDYPFEGFTFIIDAGHGGTDSGALGPMGAAMSESVLVLAQANLITAQLEALGAQVVRIRDTDTFYTLQQRVNISRATRPDMFISLHTNATAETTDATNIRGFTVWFRNENSRPAAEIFLDMMHNVNPDTNRSRQVNQANFFVCRPMWSPAILLEASFTNNIHDFAWMINPRRQEEYARAVVNALLAYYR